MVSPKGKVPKGVRGGRGCSAEKNSVTILFSLQLLSMKKNDTLALKVQYYADPINYILFCVNLLYADENASPSVTRFHGSDEDIEGIQSGDHDLEENSGFNEE